MTRNLEYELWYAAIHNAPQSVIDELERLLIEAEGGVEPAPEPASWLGNISQSMITKAKQPGPYVRQFDSPAGNTNRSDLLSPSRSVSTSDRFGRHITDYGAFVEKGFKR